MCPLPEIGYLVSLNFKNYIIFYPFTVCHIFYHQMLNLFFRHYTTLTLCLVKMYVNGKMIDPNSK